MTSQKNDYLVRFLKIIEKIVKTFTNSDHRSNIKWPDENNLPDL